MFCPEQADEGALTEDESIIVIIGAIAAVIACADVRDDVRNELWWEVGCRCGHSAYREESDVEPEGRKSMRASTDCRLAGYM